MRMEYYVDKPLLTFHGLNPKRFIVAFYSLVPSVSAKRNNVSIVLVESNVLLLRSGAIQSIINKIFIR